MSDVRKEMEKNRASVLVVTALDEVACTPCHFLSLVKDLISIPNLLSPASLTSQLFSPLLSSSLSLPAPRAVQSSWL